MRLAPLHRTHNHATFSAYYTNLFSNYVLGQFKQNATKCNKLQVKAKEITRYIIFVIRPESVICYENNLKIKLSVAQSINSVSYLFQWGILSTHSKLLEETSNEETNCYRTRAFILIASVPTAFAASPASRSRDSLSKATLLTWRKIQS